MTGRAQPQFSPQNAVLVKFTPDGSIIWEQKWLAKESTGAEGIAVGPNGNIFITGNTTFGVEESDAIVVQFLPDGRVQRTATWSGTTVQVGQAIALGPDNNVYVAGYTTGPPPYRFRVASKRTGTPASVLEVPTGTVTTPTDTLGDPNGTVLTANGSETYAGAEDAFLLRIAPMGVSAPLAGAEPRGATATLYLARNHPNPFVLKTDVSFRLGREENVSIVVLDVQGRLVKTLAAGVFPAGEHRVSWDGRDANRAEMASGMYFYRIKAGESSETKKMMLMRR